MTTSGERASVWVFDDHRYAADAIAEIAHGLGFLARTFATDVRLDVTLVAERLVVRGGATLGREDLPARSLGVSREGLGYKLQKHGIDN